MRPVAAIVQRIFLLVASVPLVTAIWKPLASVAGGYTIPSSRHAAGRRASEATSPIGFPSVRPFYWRCSFGMSSQRYLSMYY